MYRITRTLLLVAMLVAAPWHTAIADGDWMISLHAGQTDVDRLVRSDGPWWNQIDDDHTSYGASIGYEWIRALGFRLMYERVGGLTGLNRCPDGMTCPALAITEDTDAELWSLAALPRLHLTDSWSIFGTLGLMSAELDSDTILPSSSETELTYGVGASWRPVSSLDLGVEYQRSELEHETVRLNLGWRF